MTRAAGIAILDPVHDSAAKSYYVITLKGDRGPYSRADLHEALRTGEVRGEDRARNAFGRPLGTVAQVLNGPPSDRAAAARASSPRPMPAVRPAPPPPQAWKVPLLIALVAVALVALLMALRGGGREPAAAGVPARVPVPAPAPAPAQAPERPVAAVPVPAGQDPLQILPEARGYRLVADADLKTLGKRFAYRIDHRENTRAIAFDRIAYLVELAAPGAPDRYVWTAMDAFTGNPGRIAMPTHASGGFFQLAVANLQVRSNVPGISTGDFPAGGNIEFWPCDYTAKRSAAVPTASDDRYDVGDTPTLAKNGSPAEGHGSMQVHNGALRQTLFAINNWRAGPQADLGIGNAPGYHPDWTFAANAGTYTSARLRVLVRPR